MVKIKSTLLGALVLALLVSCGQETSRVVEISSSGGAATSDLPIRWSASSLSSPLDLRISTSFNAMLAAEGNDGNGHNMFEQMAKQWDDADGSNDFFRHPANTTANKDNGNLSSYNDGVLGIYRSDNWYSGVSSNALAITQFFGVRQNVGTSNEFLELVHADIMVNFRDYNFSFDENSTISYELATVILHEMGHFLGLPHETNSGVGAVMQPYLSSFDSKRTLFAADSNAIIDNYSANSLTAAVETMNVSGVSTGAAPKVDNKVYRGIIELRADGKCVHFIEGVKVKEHDHNLELKHVHPKLK
jgi:hypothetical protein